MAADCLTFQSVSGNDSPNELVIRIQPDEAIYVKINNKIPGLGVRVGASRLDLKYQVC